MAKRAGAAGAAQQLEAALNGAGADSFDLNDDRDVFLTTVTVVPRHKNAWGRLTEGPISGGPNENSAIIAIIGANGLEFEMNATTPPTLVELKLSVTPPGLLVTVKIGGRNTPGGVFRSVVPATPYSSSAPEKGPYAEVHPLEGENYTLTGQLACDPMTLQAPKYHIQPSSNILNAALIHAASTMKMFTSCGFR